MPRIEGIAQPFAQRTQGMQPEPPLRKESVKTLLIIVLPLLEEKKKRNSSFSRRIATFAQR